MSPAADPPYRDASLPTDERVADLLERLTLEEKAGQLVGTWAGVLRGATSVDAAERQVAESKLGAVASFGWGGAATHRLAEIVETVNRLQETATTETRLGIPLCCPVDAVHGHAYVAEATAFPTGLGLAATWNPSLAEAVADVTATEVRATGAHQNYAPTCDVARDPRWGRTFETFGESPVLCARLAAASVRGYQGDGLGDPEAVIATAKHFPAYGEPVAGEDAAPVEVSPYLLETTFLPAFAAAIDAGVESVMPCYNSVDGEPAHASRRLLTTRLREDLGFEGTVVSDWNGVRMLHEDHRVARDHRESVKLSRSAGLDVASVGAPIHADLLVDLVESGDLDEALLDESVERVIERKVRLGLFEDPYVDLEVAREVVGCDAHRDLALEAARESVTLLSNDGTLPFDPASDVLVTGPNADAPIHQLGGWSVLDPAGTDVVTVRDGLAAVVDGEVTYEAGAGINEEGDTEAAARAARDADVALVVLGEPWYIHEFGPSARSGTKPAEFPRRTSLRLPAAQRSLVDAIDATGTPTVAVLVAGRPLAVGDLVETSAATLMAYYPGTLGGQAVAETLVGANEPAGRLPISVPRSEGHLPTRFNHLVHPTPIGADEHPPSYDPLFAFGHGLSYASFDYGDVELAVGPDGSTTVAVPVENTAGRAGTETVQVYASDHRGRRVRPVRELRGFERVTLDPGEARTVEVTVQTARPDVRPAGGDDAPPAGPITLHVGEQSREVHVDPET